MSVNPTLIVAGATGYGVWPANTMEGLRRCLAAPVDGVEIDVQMTADGHVVAHHDYWLDPEATRLNGQWLETRGPPLKTLTLAELERFDVGALRPGSRAAARYPALQSMDGLSVPTLRSILELLASAPGDPCRLYIEVKTDPTRPDDAPAPAAVLAAMLDEIDRARWSSHTKIIAFDWQVLRLMRTVRPEMATAHLTIPPRLVDPARPTALANSPWFDGFDPHLHVSELAAIKAHGGMEWSPYYTDVTPDRVGEAVSLGLKVGPWGLSTAEDIARMQDLCVFSATVSGPAWGR
jgi:glycerophosphoryl diester phosphodiesterase